MEKQLRDEFNIPVKHITEQKLGLWRNFVMLIGSAMEKLLRDEFNIPAKHSTEQELGLWRKFVMPVKNRRRRFRYVANLEKRMEAREARATFKLYMEALKAIVGDQLDLDMASEKAEQILQDNTETRFQNEALTAVSVI